MKNAKSNTRGSATHPVTTVRIDPELVYRAKQRALKNKREGAGRDRSFSAIVNSALAQYMKRENA